MGKKHKKHHKNVQETTEEADSTTSPRTSKSSKGKADKSSKNDKPIKLVLKVAHEKVASKDKSRNLPETSTEVQPVERLRDHGSKKKKKKRSGSKERKKHRILESDMSAQSSPAPSEKSRKRDRVEMDGGESDISSVLERPIKKIHIKPIEPPKQTSPKPLIMPEIPKAPSPLALCLENLHRTLQRKDVHGFFAFPVTDSIAPGYSLIIRIPMDFSTMKAKIDKEKYSSIEEFKNDFILMCDNAMIYNAPETVYYKDASKMLQSGLKLLTPEKIRSMYRSIGWETDEYIEVDEESGERGLSDETIDVDTVDNEENILISRKKDKSKREKGFQPSKKITQQVQEAARRAAKALAERNPRGKFGFLRKDKDGKTTLAILNPDNSQACEDMPVNLKSVSGKVSSGSHSTAAFKEDKKNKATPVSYLMYGPFGSFAPIYDSSKSTISKEESDLLFSTYGDETGIHYAQSLQAFVKDCDPLAQELVDRLLDGLTDGAHSKHLKIVEEKLKAEEAEAELARKLKEQEEAIAAEAEKEKQIHQPTESKEDVDSSNKENRPDMTESTQDVNININLLLTLESEGIDVSFLKTKDTAENKVEKKGSSSSSVEAEAEAELQRKLDENTQLIQELQQTQEERMATRPFDTAPTPEISLKPNNEEKQLASKIVEGLKDLTSQVKPEEVAAVEAIRAAMGVGFLDDDDDDEDEPMTGVTASLDTPLGQENNDGDNMNDDDDEEDDEDEEEDEEDEEEKGDEGTETSEDES